MPVWAPSGDVICFPVPDIPSTDDLCFPGGFCLSHVWNGINQIPSAADVWLQFYSQIGPAMSFLAPFFNVLDTCLAIFRCVQAVPDAITNLDPTELFQCVPELVEKINDLLGLIPQLSIPRMVKRILEGLATLLRAVASDLQYIQQQLARIADQIDRAADLNDVTMSGFLSCAESTVNDTTLSTAEALKGIGRIILLCNLLISLFGGPEIPCFSSLLEDLDVLDTVIDALLLLANLIDEIADMIPDPQLAITLLLESQEC